VVIRLGGGVVTGRTEWMRVKGGRIRERLGSQPWERLSVIFYAFFFSPSFLSPWSWRRLQSSRSLDFCLARAADGRE